MRLVSIMSDERGQPAGPLLSSSAQRFTRARVQEPEKNWVSLPHGSGRSRQVALRPVFNWHQTKSRAARPEGHPASRGRSGGAGWRSPRAAAYQVQCRVLLPEAPLSGQLGPGHSREGPTQAHGT